MTTSVNIAPPINFTEPLCPLGFVYTYVSNTSTRLDTYQDPAGTVLNSWPVPLDVNGSANIYLTAGSLYRFVVQYATGVVLYDVSSIAAPNSQYATSAALTAFEATVATELTGYVPLATLASSTGSSLMGYNQGSTGAATITQQAVNQRVINMGDFYANGVSGALVDPTGVVDSTVGIQNFYNSVTTNGAFGIKQPGVFLVSAPLTINIGSKGFSIVGTGSSSCQLKSATTFSGGTSVLSLLGSSTTVTFKIEGFGINPVTVGSAGTATSGFQIGNPSVATIAINGFSFSTITDVVVNNYLKCWNIAHARMIYFSRCGAWLTGLTADCDGIYIWQNGAFTGDLVFDACQVVQNNSNANTTVNIESLVGPYNTGTGYCSIAGIKFKDCDFYAGYQSIRLYATAASQISDIWFVDGCQIDQVTYNNVYVESNNSGTLIQDLHFDHMYQSAATNAGMSFTSTGTLGTIKSIWIEGTQISDCSNAAISFYGSGCQELHVNNNAIVDCAATGSAIVFNGSTGVQCNFNKARTGSLSQLPYYLVGFLSGTTDIVAIGNDGASTTNINTIYDASGSISQKIIMGNPGFNPIGAGSVTVTASPFSYKNNTGSPISASLSGGTTTTPYVTALTLESFGLQITNIMNFVVPQGATLVVTYSGGTPTLNVFGM